MWTHTNTPAAKEFVESLISTEVMAELVRASMHDHVPDPANLEVQLTALLGYYEQDRPKLMTQLRPREP